MSTDDSRTIAARTAASAAWPLALFRTLITLDVVAILLQGLWAGVFLEHDGKRDAAGNWIDAHAHGAEIAIALTIAATLVAAIWLRARNDLWIAGTALAILLVLEAYLGGLIRDDSKDVLTAVHVPLGMLLMTVVAILAARALKRH